MLVHQAPSLSRLVRKSTAYGPETCTSALRVGIRAVIMSQLGSFNASGEPLVYSPLDALVSARKMSLDFLAGDGWLCELD